MCDSALVLYLLTYLAELLCGEGAAAITVERLEPAQGETNGRHRLSRAAERLRATPSPWDIKQGRPRTKVPPRRGSCPLAAGCCRLRRA